MSVETLKQRMEEIKNSEQIIRPLMYIDEIEQHLKPSPVEWLANQLFGNDWKKDDHPWHLEVMEAMAMENKL